MARPKRKEISFACTEEETRLVCAIVDRAAEAGHVRSAKKPDHWYQQDTMAMDLIACNANGCPLDFQRLLDADGLNFIHDVAGIARHMDRDTGQLTDCFRPRHTRRSL